MRKLSEKEKLKILKKAKKEGRLLTAIRFYTETDWFITVYFKNKEGKLRQFHFLKDYKEEIEKLTEIQGWDVNICL